MMKWYITLFAVVAAIALWSGSKHRRIKVYYENFRTAPSHSIQSQWIEEGKAIMCTQLLPYILSKYRDERDIQFTVGMIGVCRTEKDNAILWKKVRNPSTGREIRLICMAQLVARGQHAVWQEITEEDIDIIAQSMPVHIVHWKQLVLQYSGRPKKLLKEDRLPERTKFRALFRKCIEKSEAEEAPRPLSQTTIPPTRQDIMELQYSDSWYLVSAG